MERLMAVAVFLLGAGATIVGINKIRLALSMRRWPAADGEVRSSSVLEVRTTGVRSRRRYRPEILYAFVVGGIEYTGVRRTLFAVRYGGPDYPAKVVAQYPVGHPVTVYYDPGNPRESILIRDTALPWAACVTAVGIYFCAAIARWFFR